MVIKKCPFCGYDAKLISRLGNGDYDLNIIYYDIICTNDDCYLSDGVDWNYTDENELIDLWNNRPIRENKLKRILE